LVHLVGFAIEIILRCTAPWTSNLRIIYLQDYTKSHSKGSYSSYWQPSGSRT